jgi:hypothetical protein
MYLPFHKVDLRQPIEVPRAGFGFCTDVMEHIEPKHVDAVIQNVMRCVDKCFFQISLIPDVMGKLIGHELHLSVHPIGWWRETFNVSATASSGNPTAASRPVSSSSLNPLRSNQWHLRDSHPTWTTPITPAPPIPIRALAVMFYSKPIENEFQSMAQGRPIFEDGIS